MVSPTSNNQRNGMKKLTAFLLFAILAALPVRAAVLLQDSSNYPYTNGCIEGQGPWYSFYPATPALDALVTNNVLLLNTTNKDEVAAPTAGWANSSYYTFASFSLNVSQLPSASGGYFCQFQDLNGTNHCCHVFIDTKDTVVPGTYRLGIANYATSFAGLVPPHNFPVDLAPGVNYMVVVLFDSDNSDPVLGGSTLWVNPSEADWNNAAGGGPVSSPGIGQGYVYGTDTTAVQSQLNINVSQIGFSPYADAGISNVMVATTFEEVNTTNSPVIGIQPQSATNYSGNSVTLYTVASGVDVAYRWYSQTTGALVDDGVNIIGSESNILVLNNLSTSDVYYAVATDIYGLTAASDPATNTVNTTPTAPFFSPPAVAVNLTNNLFTTAGFTNTAVGTGPLVYQWYFAPTNTPNIFSPLAGQNGPALTLSLVDYTFAGSYFVSVSNTVAGGSLIIGPTNTLTETAPTVATISQLHNLMISLLPLVVANKSGTVNVNTNNVVVGGYVTGYGGFGSTYTEFFIQDAAGYGIQVYLGGYSNTNTPPVGTYVTVTGPVVVYHTELEIEPTSPAAIVVTPAPVIALAPKLANGMFNDLSTNGLGTNAVLNSCSLVTFTNVYIYGNKTGGAIGNGGLFYSNSYSSSLYFTLGKYHYPDNTNWIQIYQFAYNYNTQPALTLNPIGGTKVPTYCAQITGAFLSYGGSPEILPSRLADYLTNTPPAFSTTIAESKSVPTLTWPAQTGATYSVWTTTNLLAPWTRTVQGIGYYPATGTYTDTNKQSAELFYQVTTP